MMARSIWCVLFLAVPLAAAFAAPRATVGGRDVAYWKPSGPVPVEGYPLIVFSHGFGGSSTQSTFLMEAMANAGYLVLAPDHADARKSWYPGSFLLGFVFNRPEEPFRKEAEWSDATYRDRRDDIEAILDGVFEAKAVAGVPVDLKRVGLAGHSLGGYTVLGLAGAWPSWKDPRVKAVLALSPYCSPYVLKGDLGRLGIPVMYQGGTRDPGVTPTVRKEGGAFDASSSPKFYVEFDGAGHLAWTDLSKRYHALIARTSVAFFDRYLKGVTTPDPLAELTAKPFPKGVSSLEVSR
jgi:predicted dienelactone hydrolase